MRKAVLVSSLVVALVAVSAACGSSGSEGTGGEVRSVNQGSVQGTALGEQLDLSQLSPDIKDPDTPVTIRFESPWGQSPLIQKLAKQFHQIHPNITIKFENVPFENMQTKLTAQIAGGNAPDTAYLDSSIIGAFAPRGALVNLEDYMSKSKGAVKDDYVDAFKRMNSYQEQMFGLPYDGESTGLFYRTDLFEAAGITSPPTTWAEFEDAAAKLTNPDKRQYGIAMFATTGETSYYFTPWLFQAGGSQTTEDDNAPALNTPEAIKAAEFYTGLAKYSPPDLWASNSYDGRVAFATGKVGMYIAGAWLVGDLQRGFPKVSNKWATAPLPTMESGTPCATTIAGNSLVIFSQSKNQDAAWKWIEFLSAPQNMSLWNIGTKKEPSSLLPPRNSLLNDPKVFENNPLLEGFADNMKCGITNQTDNSHWGEVDQGPLSQALANAIYGRKDAATAMNEAQAQAEEIFSKPI